MPRTALENAKIRDQRRQDLLNVCLELFSRQGFEAVTINDIVHLADCSHGLFYHYFRDKDDAFLAVINMTLNDMKQLFPYLEGMKEKPRNGLRDLTSYLLEIVSKDRNRSFVHELNIYVSLHSFKTDRRTRFYNQLTKMDIKSPYEIIKETFVRGQDLHELKEDFSPEDLAMLYLNLMTGLISNRIALGQKRFAYPSVEVIMAIFVQ
ncbi:MAG: TetR/AcrR family transcriptional regulator [Bacilli bacterium]|jgi:AcrR family transcriptional regulator|nr:TetR/AcrR family transcriptional regulator [Bacilli bacterium]